MITNTKQQKRKQVLVLYSELAAYMLACFYRLVQTHPVEVHVVRKPLDPNAPFKFPQYDNIHYYERNQYSTEQLVALSEKIQPDFIFCNGWIDKGYLDVCRKWKGKIATALSLDNSWEGTLKQNIAALAGPFYLKRYFSHIWVPGKPQVFYAKKLGFNEHQIFTGMYAANVEVYNNIYQKNRAKKENKFPHIVVYVGRYLELKGVKEMWEAFIKFHKMMPNDWQLWCIGKGDLEFPDHPFIKNLGFLQPEELQQYMAQTGVLILSSRKDHWGMTVHEFASAGFPLICSDKTYAYTAFLQDGKNGFLHRTLDVDSIVEALIKLNNTTDKQLLEMGDLSAQLAQQITDKTWAATAWQLINTKV